jgi:hypothetical protein
MSHILWYQFHALGVVDITKNGMFEMMSRSRKDS